LFLDEVNKQQRDTFIAEIDSIQAITRPDAVTAETVAPIPARRNEGSSIDPTRSLLRRGKGRERLDYDYPLY